MKDEVVQEDKRGYDGKKDDNLGSRMFNGCNGVLGRKIWRWLLRGFINQMIKRSYG